GQAGSGVFVAPTAIADYVCAQYGVQTLGVIDTVRDQLYAITTQRRMTHPAVIAVSNVARNEVFGSPMEG
ncbi:MAG: LysR family transcriptional regulator, partial [Solimonas sp.]